MAKNMEWYIKNNDFEGAKERLETTSSNWKKRWFEVCETIFRNCKELAKKYILNPLNKTISEIGAILTLSKRKSIKYQETIQVENGVDLLDNAIQKCYLFSFYDEFDNLICSKVGTTIRTVRQRLKEELNSKTYKDMGCVRAVVHRVYDCGELPAEGLESYFRAKYIKKYPNSFKKNDRFINEFFDLVQADKIAEKYLKNA